MKWMYYAIWLSIATGLLCIYSIGNSPIYEKYNERNDGSCKAY